MKTKFFLNLVTRLPKSHKPRKLRKSALALIVLGILLSACGAAEFANAPTVIASPPTQAAAPAKASPASTVAQPTAAAPDPKAQPQNPNQNVVDVCGKFNLNTQLSVQSTNAKYATATTYTSNKFFTTGQSADIVLSAIDFDNAGGGLLFNHPSGIASDGTRLLLVDRNNNRVLIWNTAPSGNTAPDIVLGQTDFTHNNPGKELNGMNWPSAVSVTKNKVVVADTVNQRILVWSSFPTQNGQAADFAFNFPELGTTLKENLNWPWGVWTDGEKLIVASTQGASGLLIWNKFPTKSSDAPDLVIKNRFFGTPRYIASDGKNMMVWDHNVKIQPKPGSPEYDANTVTSRGTFYWNTLPTTRDGKETFVNTDRTFVGGTFTSDGKFLAVGDGFAIWNSFPKSLDQKPDVDVKTSGVRIGDSLGVAVAGGRVYIVEGNANKIIVYNLVPTRSDQKHDFVIGASELCVNTLAQNFIITNPRSASNGKSLFVISDFDRKLYVWKSLPNQSNAYPDFVYTMPQPGNVGSLTLWKETLIVGGENIFVWKKLPLNGEKPDLTISAAAIKKHTGSVALDDKYFYLADTSGKVYVWQGLPTTLANPSFTLNLNTPISSIKSDGNYLTLVSEKTVKIYKVAELSANAQPMTVQGNSQTRFNMLGSAITIGERLLVADTVNGRVLGWDSVADAANGKNPTLILGATDLSETVPEIGRDKLYWPSDMNFDGTYLWVGEFKFSVRLLRFGLPK